VISAAILVVVGLAIVVAGAGQEIGTLARPGPGFLPTLAGAVLAGLGGVVFVTEWRATRAAAGGPVTRTAVWPVVATVVALVAYAALLVPLGFVTTTFVVLGFLFRVVAGLRWAVALGSTVTATALSYLLFSVWLKVPFPPGPWSP